MTQTSGKPNFFSRIFFSDVEPLVSKGYSKRLNPNDLLQAHNVETEILHRNFDKAYKAKRAQTETELRRMVRSVSKGNGWLFCSSAVLYIISQAAILAGPLLLLRIVRGLECPAVAHSKLENQGVKRDCASRTQLYYYTIGLFVAPLIQSVTENHYMFQLYTIGTRMRNALMAAIYRKCLRLSNTSLQAESTGKIVTLMSNDAQKMQDAIFGIHATWGSPLFIVAVLVLLYQQVGWATFVGLTVMIVLVPVTGVIGKKLVGLRCELVKFTDQRVGHMNEIINGIQMIKYYAWEGSFKDVVMDIRAKEARTLKCMIKLQSVFSVLLFAGPVAVAVFCFGSYTLAGHDLTASKAYTALALFTIMRFPMSYLPMIISMVVNAFVGLKRIGAFLERSEVELAQAGSEANTPAGNIIVQNCDFAWDEKGEPVLRDISFKAKPGQLTMVVGPVGSGKSSILGALIGQITRRKGRVMVGGSIAYVAQSAWIMNDTVQENVLLGAPMDPERYRMAIEVSQLGPDLDILSNGDLTEIGDRGITLSGGQKQRVSIARAVYADADVYILDDPLSAVDAHVGRVLFDECIRGHLKSKTVVLVTNALQYLPHADNILWLDNTTIKAQGSYEQLVAAGLDIAELVHLEEEGEGEEEGVKVADGKDGAKQKLQRNITLHRAAAGANRNLTGEEAREAGSVFKTVLWTYLAAAGGTIVLVSIVMLLSIEQALRVYTDTWVGIWFQDTYHQGSLWFYLGIYGALGLLCAAGTFVRCICLLYSVINASLNLHNRLLDHMLRLPKLFFDTNPAGRILNRFSRDIEIMDSVLGQDWNQLLPCVANYLAILVVICITTKWFAVALVPLGFVYFCIQRYYIPSGRELQRIESISRSPIYSRFTEALQGVSTIRAYQKQEHFISISNHLMQDNASAYITQKLAASWLATRLDLLGLIIVTLAGVLCIQGAVNPGLAGLCLVYALDLTRYLKWGTNLASKTEADLNSVERVAQYLVPNTEADPDTRPDVAATLPPEWPTQGALSLVKLQMRYRPETPFVLKGVSFNATPGEKVGIVGRTGSGKSSLFVALFRMVEPESGSIIIDGVDCARLGLKQLRRAMSIIPQDPFMFSGTVRHNLDPFRQYSDEQLWGALESVGLKEVVGALEKKLEALVADGGVNFSLGQRQLFCMARAMLRSSRLLMLDEATASIDPETDAFLQQAIRTVFASTTTLTIAHRLNTIMDSDKVVVMDDGVVAEFDTPDALLKTQGKFTSLVEQTGKHSAAYLKDVARQASMKHSNSQRSLKHADSNLGTLSMPFFPTSDTSSDAAAAAGHIPAATDTCIVVDQRLEIVASTSADLSIVASRCTAPPTAPEVEQTALQVASTGTLHQGAGLCTAGAGADADDTGMVAPAATADTADSHTAEAEAGAEG